MLFIKNALNYELCMKSTECKTIIQFVENENQSMCKAFDTHKGNNSVKDTVPRHQSTCPFLLLPSQTSRFVSSSC